jgi:hypothetical protein
MESYKPETVGKPSSQEKHSSWFTQMKEKVTANNNIGFKTLVLGISLALAQQEAASPNASVAEDIKRKLGYGLAARAKTTEDIEDISASPIVYESQI